MRNSKLGKKISKSQIDTINIDIDGEKVSFKLHDELQINENIINKELKEQPSLYGFIGMAHRRMVRVMKDAELGKDREYARAFVKYKGQTVQSTGRPMSDDLAKQKALSSSRYLKAAKKYNLAEEQAGILNAAVKAFEQRKDVLQAVNANIRKERT